MTYRLAVIPGDGIGPEVIAEGLKILDTVAEISSFSYDAETYDIGADRYLRTGELLTDADIASLKKDDAIYFGATGSPRVRPGILEKGILLKMRAEFDQYINLRPVRSYRGHSPLRDPADFDIAFIRENTEDFYIGADGAVNGDGIVGLKIERGLYRATAVVDMTVIPADEVTFELGMLSRKGVERFADYVFDKASERGDPKVTLVDKANVCGFYAMQRKIFAEKAAERGMALEYMYADAMAMSLISRPETFHTVAMPNMFGDILTDLGAQLQGGLGLSAGGNINPNGVSMFEPIHGSAPDIAGKGIANPIAAILAAKMMLEYLGRMTEANIIEKAVDISVNRGSVTPDLGGKMSTSDVGSAIRDEILSAR